MTVVDALRQLHQHHASAVRAYALRRSDPQTADEVCAEVWSIAWRRIDEIPQDALPWLFGVARRVLANERRRQHRFTALQERLSARRGAGMAEPPPLPEDPVLGNALRRLKPADAEVLLLIAWEDLSPERAAAALGVRPGTFAVRLHRARARLAAALQEEAAARERDQALAPPRPLTKPAEEITR
jgi:RNA polymerase sigma-70 factor (ECF subfamily)